MKPVNIQPDNCGEYVMEHSYDPRFDQNNPEHMSLPVDSHRQQREPGAVRTRIKRLGRNAGASLMAVGALSLVNQFSDFDIPFGDFFDHGQTEVTGGVSDIKTDVKEYSGKVTAEINSTVDIDVVRSLSNFDFVYCEEAVHENDLPLNGLLVVNTGNITVESKGKRAEVHISAFDTPVLALPVETPILSEPGDGTNLCTQKDPGEFKKDLSDKAYAKRRKIKEDSPENAPIVIASKLLKATSLRIGECVLNKANDEGSDVNKLLSMTIAKDIANDRGISPKDVDVYFDFKDTDEGVKVLRDVKDTIIKEQKEKTDAKVKINIEKAVNCNADDISVMLSSNKSK